MEEQDPSLSASKDSFQGLSGQTESCGKCFHCNSEESTQDPFKKAFMKAWKAIEDGEIHSLKQAIQKMNGSEAGSFRSLDTCCRIEKSGLIYSMSLLAFCGFHGRKNMIDQLLENGADVKAECDVHTGTLICQLMLHCLLQGDEKLSVYIIKYFKEKGAKLNGKIITHHVGRDPNDNKLMFGVLDLPLSMKKIECAKQLVEIGVDLISGGSADCEKIAIVPMFQEYRDYGTNEFICWAFNEYIPKPSKIDLKRIIQSIIHMKERDKNFGWWPTVQRSPAHAVLTCRHKETIKCLIECAEKDFKYDLLGERSCNGKTALHVAVENNDVESVNILLQLGADTRVTDTSGMNPFMLAVEKGHLEVMKAMMKKDPGLMSSPVGRGPTVIHWALKQGHHRSDFFEGWFEKVTKDQLNTKDSQGNTIAHVVAASENTEVFEMLWSEEFQKAVFYTQNSEGKTPLQLAVEKGHVNILETLESCIDKGEEFIAPVWRRKLKTDWWKDMVKCILYASSNGSLRAVKYFIGKGQKPNIRHDGKTPLMCAAGAGHDEIVAYLLGFEEVQADLKHQQEKVDNASASPLLIAAQNGHTKCVTLLLHNGGNVFQRDSEDRNCLILAIQNHHKDTALAILSVKDGLEALKTSPTPLQLLIKEMPELAEYVMNKCITQAGEDEPVRYNFDILTDQVPHKDHDNYTLVWMIEHNKLKLLSHPLVEAFFVQKFWVKTFPLFVIKLLLYCLFLVALNLFVWVIPRPGPDSETCQSEDGSQILAGIFLAATAIVLCILGLVEYLQLKEICWRYFKNPDNYFQLASYTLSLIFIVSLLMGNDNWHCTPWQWQIGAFAVFFSWLNFIFILKYIPCTAGPINMFFSICVAFLKLMFLAIPLILTFGIPFYMVFVKESGNLIAFKSPIQAIAKTIVQLSGEFDFEVIFNQGTLLNGPTTYILFFIFLMTGPILFSNFLNALAVGKTLKKLKKVKLTTNYFWMKLILKQGWMKGLYTYGDCKTEYSKNDDSSRESRLRSEFPYFGFVLAFLARGYSEFAGFFLKTYSIHAEIAKECKQRNEEIYSTVMAQKPVREDDIVASHKAQHLLREDISKLKEDIKQEMMNPVESIKEEMTKLKEDIKQEMMLLSKSKPHPKILIEPGGYMRGVDVIGEASVRVTNQSQNFHWVGYGLKLHIPEKALPTHLEECKLLIKVGISGQFALPENTSLVSAVYWLDSEPRCTFSKHLTVQIQHCALSSQTSRLNFAVAKCSQSPLPYTFKILKGGEFSNQSTYGCIELQQFSLITLLKRILLGGENVRYRASLYYLRRGVAQRDIHFVITRDQETHATVVQREYTAQGATIGSNLSLEFKSETISLRLSPEGVTLEAGWKIVPIFSPTIKKEQVDNFKTGLVIPSCQLTAVWTRQDRPSLHIHLVTLDGAKEPNTFLNIVLSDFDSISPAGLHSKYPDGLNSQPELADLMNEVAAEIPGKWRDVGLQLGLDHGALDGIAAGSPGDINHCYSYVFTRWKNQNSHEYPYAWSTVVQVLKTQAVGEDRLADKIEKKVTGSLTA